MRAYSRLPMSPAAGLGPLWVVAAALACSGCAARLAESEGLPTGTTFVPPGVAASQPASESAASNEPAPQGASSTEVREPPPPRAPNRTVRTLGWIGISVGAEAAIVAIGTSGILLHERKVRADDCNAQKLCSLDGLNANNTIATVVGWNAAAWAVTGAALGAGAALLALGWEDAKRTAAVAAAPIGSGAGIRMWSSF